MTLENPLSGSQTPPAGTGQPTHPAPAPYPAYPTYPMHPAYAPYPPYGYASAPHQGYPPAVMPPVPTLPPVPARAPDKPLRQGFTNLVLLLVLAGVTAGGLVLAAAAPSFVTRDPGPPTGGGFQQVYNSSLRTASDAWDTSGGCVFESGGLHAPNGSNPTLCQFIPSSKADYTSGGFYLTTQIAPEGGVASEELACVQFSSVGSVASFAIDQNGAYTFDSGTEGSCSTTPSNGTITQDTAAWHSEIENQVSIRYDAAVRVIYIYLNGQQLFSEGWQFTGQYTISLGTAAGTEAIFTSFGLWSASPS